MELPKYLQTLAAYKWVLAIGVLVAIVVGLIATFTVQAGQLVTREAKSYTAATTMLLSDPSHSLYQAVFSNSISAKGTRTIVTDRDLSGTATLYAYIISGSTIEHRAEAAVGRLGPDESIQAVQRTTQPGVASTTQGRLSLPLIDVIGTASTPARAQAISAAAATAFEQYAAQQQAQQNVAAANRVDISILDQAAAVEADGSNPAVPGVAAGLGVLVLFVFAVFIVDNIRTTRRLASGKRPRRAAKTPVRALPAEDSELEPRRELAGVGATEQ